MLPVAIGQVGFVDPDGGDFHLLETSQAVGAGRAAGEWSSADLDGVPRDPRAPDLGTYEFTTEPPPGDGDGDSGDGDSGDGDSGDGDSADGGDGDGGDGDDSAGETGSDSGDPASDDEAGCACTSTGSPTPAPLAWGLLGLAALVRRRRSVD